MNYDMNSWSLCWLFIFGECIRSSRDIRVCMYVFVLFLVFQDYLLDHDIHDKHTVVSTTFLSFSDLSFPFRSNIT